MRQVQLQRGARGQDGKVSRQEEEAAEMENVGLRRTGRAGGGDREGGKKRKTDDRISVQ